jgi:hypothetical protein
MDRGVCFDTWAMQLRGLSRQHPSNISGPSCALLLLQGV